ncbi:MAG: TIGR00730 family Rossman fold protein [Chloroflexi bacterium]|jgi:uncharacterized protein (TIGR00730 family)|nr:TIGR00730 family Rossman fold protein [Anaerolineaceae bacterium]NLI44415.1 TIGR00730 family Rossman fold protein [Chloroflexota bacterium]HOE34452.1 TIGR00730 family Rossman fold protein [Anaerolineaceae bacterium]HOT25462.1 TIGR00730 family Rossman fold protein [Anaerolineaceae bacterium]HQH57448.1 TIGR00730 family Rossman fold protein [Anaerolineaceae bacterium]
MPLKPIQTVTIFSGSADHLRQVYLQGAWELGAVLARRGLTLVFGGGKTGLMGAVADGALENGGQVVGVINESLNTPALAHAGLSRMEILPDLHTRKARMSALADAYIALPGGYGTFDELFEALTWAQIGLHQKPIGLLNIDRYFNPLLALLDHAIAERFIYPEHRQLIICEEDPHILLEKMQAYRPPENLSRWVERP